MASRLRAYQLFQAALNILNLVLKGKVFPYRIFCQIIYAFGMEKNPNFPHKTELQLLWVNYSSALPCCLG